LIGCAANRALQGEVKSADGKAVLAFVFSAESAVVQLFNVLADHCNGCATTATSKIARRPKRSAPELFSDGLRGKAFFVTTLPCSNTFENAS
jgi:hypothetical protein